MAFVRDMVECLGNIAPLRLAESWDNVGLLLGDPVSPVTQIMTCLTVTPEVVEEAVQKKAEMIISHHPMLFKPTQRITTESAEGRMLWKLAHSNIAIYSAHTAYDNAKGGINDQLAAMLQLGNVSPLLPAIAMAHYKIVVFVPEKDLPQVSLAAFQAGAGKIGNYEQCSYRSTGTGTFFGTEGSNPTIGQVGRREEVTEYRLEMVCPATKLANVLKAVRSAHSYEEPAMDVYPLHTQPIKDERSEGSGRIGVLTKPISSEMLAEQVSRLLQTPVTLTGAIQHDIDKMAIVCGAGGSLLAKAIQTGAKAFLTGEIRFHDELAAQAAGITVIAAGHYAAERPGMEALAQRLAELLPTCKVWASYAEQNPARLIPWSPKTTSD